MKLYIKNQLLSTIEFCCGQKEYKLEPEQEITIEAQDEDYLYFDTLKGRCPIGFPCKMMKKQDIKKGG
ncbi:hypothetical protein [Pelotomaculum propionicicum]|uniref:Uncharacterized protein n=1 Tax=Pelotomaculum propionicicum TaxID=258475 RepID=A0A4Y7RPE2_9FIRM|nr:hypothetical protein [Pelotomaculum propionicicum]TEB10656.1 hypothetical protein Pmgp_02236 [Pelotomaculum propionicicum]